MNLIYVGAALVIGGASVMLVSYHGRGPATVTDMGKILALLGFVVYVVGRIRYGKTKRPGPQPGTPPHQDKG